MAVTIKDANRKKRKRKQYQIMSYRFWDFEPTTGKLRREGREINIAENQIVELIQAIKKREYNEDGINPIPELFFLEVGDKVSKVILERHIKNGLYIDDKKYVRLVRSSSMARNGTIAFIQEDLYKPMMKLISLDKYDEIDEVVISKLESYLGLAFSTTMFIDAVPQNICIVDDSIFDTVIEDYVKGIKDGELVEGLHPVRVNLHDGMGLHTPEMGKQIARELGLKEAPVGYQIRLLPSIKGMTYEFDFKAFYEERGITYIIDKWGREWNVENLDAIWSTSMMKLHDMFSSWQEFVTLRERAYTHFGQNRLGISNYSKTEMNNKTKMTYQYLQVLDLNGDDLIELSQYTKDIVERVYCGDVGATLTYLGLLVEQDKEGNERIDEENMMATKACYAIAKNPKLIKDIYIQNFLHRQLQRTVTDMKLGRIYADGKYCFTCQDPVLMLEIIAGLEPQGCLNKNEFYMANEEGERAFFRSPLIHSSEVKKAKLVHNELAEKWLGKYKNILVMNGKDITPEQISSSDFDGDKYFITDNEMIINAAMTELREIDEEGNIITKPNYPVIDIDEQRNRELVTKVPLTQENIIAFDLRSLNNKIGEITNMATYYTTYAQANNKMISVDDKLVYLRLLQGQEIDYPKHGVRTLETPKEFYNAKRFKPRFLQMYKYDGIRFIQIDVENAPLNLLCKDIEEFEQKLFSKDKVEITDTMQYLRNIDVLKENETETRKVYAELKEVYEDFKAEASKIWLKTKNKSDEERRDIYDVYYDKYYYKANQITDNKELLSSVAVLLNYNDDNDSKSFPWICTWEGLMMTIEKTAPDTVHMPKLISRQEAEKLKLGDIQELKGKYYQMVEIANKVSAENFIINQYEKKIEKDLKKQLHNFTLETVLYGYKPRTTEEVAEIIGNKDVRLGSKEYNGKQFAVLYADDEYIASIRDKDAEKIDDDVGFIDLKSMRNKVDIEIKETFDKSMKVRLKIVS